MPARTPEIVVVGSVNVDQIVTVDHRPAAGETVGGGTLAVHGGGKGANQAVAAVQCGARVALVARVGDDAAGTAERAALVAAGVDEGYVLTTRDSPTGTAFVTVTPDGENAIVVIPGANAALTPDDVRHAAPLFRRARVVLAQLEVPLGAVRTACDLAGEGAKVVVNWSPAMPVRSEEPAHAAVLGRCDVLVVNELEATSLCDEMVRSPAEAASAAVAIRLLGPKAVVITLGEHGAVVSSDEGPLHVPAARVEIVDTTGAGDAFVAALCAALAHGVALTDAVRSGVKAGTAAAMRPGARVTVAG